MISSVAAHYKGAFPIPWAMKMTWREFKKWYDRYERETARDSVLRDLIKDDKPMPSVKRMGRMIDKKLKEWREEAG